MMTAEINIVSILGIMIAFGGLCVTIWKLRKDDWDKINNRIQSFSIELAAFKMEVSGRHPTMIDLADAERRFFDANTHTIAALNRLSDRIDRMLEREIK